MKDFEVYENNGGGLALVVYDDSGKVEYICTGYEFNQGQLSQDISCIKAGDDPSMMWDGNKIDYFSDSEINEFASGEWGKLVADNSINVPDCMTLEDAIEYANMHIDEIPLTKMNYVNGSDSLDEENCSFMDE